MTARVDGLNDLRRELKAIDNQWPKELQKANKAIARKVADRSKSTASSLGSTAAKAASSIAALAGQGRAQVRLAKKFGGEFGAAFGSNRLKQFPPHKRGGYFIWPDVADLRDEIADEYLRMVDDLTRRAFPD